MSVAIHPPDAATVCQQQAHRCQIPQLLGKNGKYISKHGDKIMVIKSSPSSQLNAK